jgi:rhodanese-related sulfurtransferase
MTDATTLTPAQARDMIASGEAILIDVREPDEFRAGHIPMALSMPLGQLDGLLAQTALPAGRAIIFQCLKGGRGGQACLVADKAGHGSGRAVHNLAGGIEAWMAAGLPIAGASAGGAGGGAAIPIMRQVQIVVGLLVLTATIAGLSGATAGFYAAAFFGFMLAFAGITGWCGMAMALQKASWNR